MTKPHAAAERTPPTGGCETDADGVAWLTLDKAGASANSLSREVMEELDAMLAELERAPPKALIVTSAKRGFIAGADIKEFVGIQYARPGVRADSPGPAGARPSSRRCPA